MKNSSLMKDAIQIVVKSMMDRVMDNVLVKDPFDVHVHRNARPLYAALVPDEIFKGSHFERRFVTPFGSVWERLAVVAAAEGLGRAVQGHTIFGEVRRERLRRIAEVLNWLEHPKKKGKRIKPDWDYELAYIMQGKGVKEPIAVTCDVYAENETTGDKFAFELKSPLPNSDITKVSKEKLLKLYAMDPMPLTAAYFALPYNPYGSKEQYGWSFPSRWFNMRQDRVVLIGDEFWEKVGGVGTYQSFIEAINEIGPDYKERIYREYLGIQPPAHGDQWRLPLPIK